MIDFYRSLLLYLIFSCSLSLTVQADELRLNQFQFIGTHNSFKQSIPDKELDLLRLFDTTAATELDYGFDKTLSEQLTLGARLLELDLYYDPQGGRYAAPLMSSIPFIGSAHVKPRLMQQPGFKVMHVQDVDYRSSCYLFNLCLQQLKLWSEQQNEHSPVLVLINLKQESLGVWGTTAPLRYNQQAMVALEQELSSVMADRLLTPSMVKKSSPNLTTVIEQHGWPDLKEVQNKFIFLLDTDVALLKMYDNAVTNPSFFSSWPATHPDAGILVINDPINRQGEINQLVKQGYIVRTRADADTYEARDNSSKRMQAAFDSGAQFIATDYIEPDFRFSTYQVSFDNGLLLRCNPLLTKSDCIVPAN